MIEERHFLLEFIRMVLEGILVTGFLFVDLLDVVELVLVYS